MSAEPQKAYNDGGPEPVAERTAVPMWALLLTALIAFGGALFMAENAGGFSRSVYAPFHSTEEVESANPQDPNQKLLQKGRGIFEKTCSACHQANAMGKEGTAPPLAGSEWVLAPGGNRIAHVVLNGLTGPITVKGQEWNLNMLAWRDTYSDEEIAAVLTYIRGNFGNNAEPIKPEMVAAARADKHPAQMTAPELLKMPEK